MATYLGNGRGGGSETWSQTVADTLRKKGHDVQLEGENEQLDLSGLDLAIISHNNKLAKYRSLACRKLFICHGVIPWLEEPIDGADAYIGVSEETKKHIESFGFPASIVRQPIDLNHFRYSAHSGTLENVLFLTKNPNTPWDATEKAARELGLNPVRLGPKSWHVGSEDVPQLLSEVDLLVGQGRTVLETLACGRPAIIAGPYGMDGYTTRDLLETSRLANYSGRAISHNVSEARLARALKEFNSEDGRNLRSYVEEFHDASMIVDQLINV